jgi:hypothetical protein
MKCITCIHRSLRNKDISNSTPVQNGVDGAADAVTVVDGFALCVEHLHERYQNMGIEEYIKAIGKG